MKRFRIGYFPKRLCTETLHVGYSSLMDYAELFQAVAFNLSSLGYAVRRGFEETVAPFELHPRSYGLLRAVGLQEGQSQQAIADGLQIPSSRMVAVVDDLEDRGLIERRAHPSDRRVRALYLTDAGRKLLSDVSERAMAYERTVTAPLTDQEREQLLALLNRIARGMGIGLAHAALDDEPDQGSVASGESQ